VQNDALNHSFGDLTLLPPIIGGDAFSPDEPDPPSGGGTNYGELKDTTLDGLLDKLGAAKSPAEAIDLTNSRCAGADQVSWLYIGWRMRPGSASHGARRAPEPVHVHVLLRDGLSPLRLDRRHPRLRAAAARRSKCQPPMSAAVHGWRPDQPTKDSRPGKPGRLSLRGRPDDISCEAGRGRGWR